MFFRCAPRSPAADQGATATNASGSKSLVVDLHCHKQSITVGDKMKVVAEEAGRMALQYGTELTKKINREQLATIIPKMTDLNERLADMDRMGVDIQAISVSPYQYYYWADDEVGRETSREINNEMAETIADAPDRLVGLGTLPMQNTEMAIAEMDHCINELGFRGFEISTHVGGKELDMQRLEKFWAKAEELDTLIFIHPDGFTHGQRMQDHYFLNIIGHPVESTLAISHLIFGGVLERHPGLKIVVAHGGGYVPAYAGRMEHAYNARADVRGDLPHPPSHYIKKLYFDTMVFDPDQLGKLIDTYGSDKIVLGTDYPYDMGEEDPVGLVNKVKGLNDHDRTCICGHNAAQLLKIDH